MLTPLKPEIVNLADPSHDARRFRTILWAFERNAELLLAGSNLRHHVDHGALAQAFASWRQAFDATNHLADIDRRDYVIYAAGLMLRELLVSKPLSFEGEVGQTLPALPDPRFARWPEGYAYTSFCLAFVSTIVGASGEKVIPLSDEELPVKFWQSFKENATEDPAMAVAFFDFICGQKPNWDAPDAPHLRHGLSNIERRLAPAAPQRHLG